MPAMTRYPAHLVHARERAEQRAPAVHGRRRGRHLRQRHARRRHQGPPRQRRERLAEGADRGGREPPQGGREHDRRPGQEPPQRQRRPPRRARFIARLQADGTTVDTTALEVERDRPRRLAAARLRRLRLASRRASSPPTAPARGAATSRSRASRARTCARTSRPTKTIAQARLYVSALGLYEVRINGQKVGDARPRARLDGVHQARPGPDLRRHEPGQVRGQRHRRRARRGLLRRPPPGRPQVGHEPRAPRPAEDHLRRRHLHPREHRRHVAGRHRWPARRRASTTARATTPAWTAPAGTSPASAAAGAARSCATRR